jgi:hypothetical protein
VSTVQRIKAWGWRLAGLGLPLLAGLLLPNGPIIWPGG